MSEERDFGVRFTAGCLRATSASHAGGRSAFELGTVSVAVLMRPADVSRWVVQASAVARTMRVRPCS